MTSKKRSREEEQPLDDFLSSAIVPLATSEVQEVPTTDMAFDEDGEFDESDIPIEAYPKIDNVIASVHLCVQLNLPELTFKIRNAEFNPRRSSSIVLRLPSPKSTLLVFQNGKILVSQARDEGIARKACKNAAKLIRDCGYGESVKFHDFKVETMAASANVNFPIRLERMAEEHRAFASYEPEIYAGLVYRMIEPKVTLTIFVSGKINIVGARRKEDILEAFLNIYPVLCAHRR